MEKALVWKEILGKQLLFQSRGAFPSLNPLKINRMGLGTSLSTCKNPACGLLAVFTCSGSGEGKSQASPSIALREQSQGPQ